MSPNNHTSRLDRIEKSMAPKSDLIIEIVPGWIYLNGKAYGDALKDFILEPPLPPGTIIINRDRNGKVTKVTKISTANKLTKRKEPKK